MKPSTGPGVAFRRTLRHGTAGNRRLRSNRQGEALVLKMRDRGAAGVTAVAGYSIAYKAMCVATHGLLRGSSRFHPPRMCWARAGTRGGRSGGRPCWCREVRAEAAHQRNRPGSRRPPSARMTRRRPRALFLLAYLLLMAASSHSARSSRAAEEHRCCW